MNVVALIHRLLEALKVSRRSDSFNRFETFLTNWPIERNNIYSIKFAGSTQAACCGILEAALWTDGKADCRTRCQVFIHHASIPWLSFFTDYSEIGSLDLNRSTTWAWKHSWESAQKKLPRATISSLSSVSKSAFSTYLTSHLQCFFLQVMWLHSMTGEQAKDLHPPWKRIQVPRNARPYG